MEANQIFDSIPKEDHEIFSNGHSQIPHHTTVDHGWQKVTYTKRQKKTKPSTASDSLAVNGAVAGGGGDNVFRSLEKKSEDRHRRILDARREADIAANSVALTRSELRSDDEDSDAEIAKENGKENEVKKPKVKKPKKPKVTVAEASAAIDANHLSAFLAEISESYESQADIRLMRFADYFGRAFSLVTSAQFPWMKMLRESTVGKMADIPISHISETVYKTSVDWINKQPVEALESIVLWSIDSLIADFASHNATTKKGVKQVSSKSQVAIFVVLALVLRRKPDALVGVLPKLREESKYQGQDKLPVLVWVILQASHGDVTMGLYASSRNLLPLLSGKSSNPQSRDLVLQLVERILSMPKARTILVNSAVRKGERLVPPASFEILMRLTFPSSSARIKATERFEAIYPTLKEVALAGSSGSKGMKQVSQQFFSFAIKAAGESGAELANEAAGIFVWCLSQSADNYKQWDMVYAENLKASVTVLKKLSDQWKELSVQLSPFDRLRETVKSFKLKNEELNDHALVKESEKYCKVILGKLSRGNGCLKAMAIVAVAAAVGFFVISPDAESVVYWEKLSSAFSSISSF